MAAPVAESSRGCSERVAKRVGMPWPQNDWSLDRLMRRYSRFDARHLLQHLPAEPVGLGHRRGFFEDGRPFRPDRVDIDVADAALVQIVPVAVGVPGGAGVAAVGVARPEGEAHPAPESPRRSARRRATSSWVALAVPLSMAPRCQESTWPLNRTNRSSSMPGRSAVRVGIMVQSRYGSVTSRTETGPVGQDAP